MGETGEIILFGVRVVVDSMRKSVSLNDLSQYEHRLDADSPKEDLATAGVGGYVSADEVLAHHASGSRGERKRGVPWSEGEHKLFLLGLKRVGKGDWRGISRNYVKTRTPTQVASHAQKYFLRHANVNRRRRRSSLFDITTDSVSATPMEEEESHDQDKNNTGSQQHLLQPAQPETSNGSTFSTLSVINRASSPVLPVSVENLGNILPGKVNEVIDLSMSLNHPIAILPAPQASPFLDRNLDLNLSSAIGPAPGKVNGVTDLSTSLNRPVASLPAPRASPNLDLNLDLNLTSMVEPAQVSLDLSLSSDRRRISSKYTAFQLMQGYNTGGSFISVV